MKTKKTIALAFGIWLMVSPGAADAEIIPIAKIIQEGVKKAIRAVDLKIQRLQNKTIWMQNAQKVIENKLSELKLKEIADWTEKNKALYEQYYAELWQVRKSIESWNQLREAMERQRDIVRLYKKTWAFLEVNKHFTKKELELMREMYSGILKESLSNVTLLARAVKPFDMQMTDGERIQVIHRVSTDIERNYNDLRRFNAENIQLSINRSHSVEEINKVRRMYAND